eukprot:1193186-Prorocentrum_minimum.AAC.3
MPQKFHKHPVTGAPLKVQDLTKLTFHKDGEGKFCCPVLTKTFTDSTHIVANKKSGHVYSMQAVQELNVKAKNWKDLVTDEPFTRADLVTIQDPLNIGCKELSKFEHVVKNLAVDKPAADPVNDFINCGGASDTQRALAALGTDAAKEAFNKGGGGNKSEAERILAAAKQAERAAKQERKEAKRAEEAGTLEAPDSIVVDAHLKRAGVVFKPGAMTWSTDEPVKEKKGKKVREGKSLLRRPSTAPRANNGALVERRPSRRAYESLLFARTSRH